MERLAETREKESQEYGKKRKKNNGDREIIDYFRGCMIENSILRERN